MKKTPSFDSLRAELDRINRKLSTVPYVITIPMAWELVVGEGSRLLLRKQEILGLLSELPEASASAQSAT